jgi:hypothetical protein
MRSRLWTTRLWHALCPLRRSVLASAISTTMHHQLWCCQARRTARRAARLASQLPMLCRSSSSTAVDAAVVVTSLKLDVGQAELERWLGRAATVENIGLFRPGQALVQHYNMPGAAEQVQAIQHDQVGLHLASGPAGLTAHFAASATHTGSASCFFAGHILHLLSC